MDINALFQALQPFENTSAGTFTMPLAQVDPAWADIRALLTGALAAETLSITGIAAFPSAPGGGTITYRGQATLFTWSGATGGQAALAVTAWFTVDGNGQPQVLVQAVPPAGWNLGESLSGLQDTPLETATWDDGAFLVTSTTTTQAQYPGPVRPWVNFSGVVAVAGPFARTGALLASRESRALAGHVDVQPAMPVTTLAPAFPRPVDLGGVSFEMGARLASYYKTFPDAPGDPVPPYPVAEATVAASVGIGGGTVIPLSMPLTDEGDALAMQMVGPPVSLTGLTDLLALSGGTPLDVLPPGAPTPSGFVLAGLSLAVELGDGQQQPTRSSINFDVSLETGGWPLLPAGILTLEQIGVALRVDFDLNAGLNANAVLYGRVTIAEEMKLLASVAIPSLDAALGLDDGSTVSVASLMEQFMVRLTGRAYRPPVDMILERLDVALSVRTGQFQVGAAITTDWEVALGEYNGGALVTFGFDGITLLIAYDGSVLSGNLTAFTHIGSSGFYLSAETAGGPTAGWDLGFGLMAGSTIPVSQLLLSFLYPQGQQPGDGYGIPSLVVNALDLFLATDTANTPYDVGISGQVEGSWSFKVFSEQTQTFTMAAAFDLAGQRPTVDHLVPRDAEWSISGSVSGRFTLFGLLIEAAYRFDVNNSALSFGIWYGNRGLEAVLARKTVRAGGSEVVRTVLTVRLGSLSLGEILEFFVNLALPGETRRLPAPWDVLYQIDFRNLTLSVDLDTYDTSVDYALNLNLGFASLTGIGILYTSAGGEGQVLLQLRGDFLGQPYGTDDDSEPLTWDVLREPAPSVPGKGSGLIDIRYVGLGQHVALPVPDSQLKTVTDVITALKAAMGPVAGGGNPLDSPTAAGMRYDASSKWLFGVDATLIETLSLSAVFYDPHLYGALIEMAGERAGALAGLRFELMYRRINDAIGEFSVDLRVPDAFRNWEFGEVSVTLGILHVDIFTNGNFRVNAGFPANGDFSVSFAVQVFPFIGQGGFYFAYLTGATSERVPQVTNGTFDPVIEAGVGLAVGVGKEFQKGPLSAGLALEVYGIFEGVYAPFHPYQATVPKGTYYWFQGTAGVVGKLYGSVDFVVVKASVSVVARAQAVLTLEAHRASYVELNLEVTAKAKIKVLFVTIHFSFSLTLDASFTLGSSSPTPWVVGAAPAPALDTRRALTAGMAAPAPRLLRQQRSQAPRPDLLAVSRQTAPSRMAAAGMGDAAPGPWAPVAVYGEGRYRTARFQFLPAFTVADPATTMGGETGDGNQVQIVLLLAAENTIDPRATTAEEVRVVSTGHLHQVDEEGSPAFGALVETFFRWAALEGAGVSGTQTLGAEAIAALVTLLRDPAFVAATFAYGNLSQLLDESLHFEVLNFPVSDAPASSTSGTFLAMIPGITATFTAGGASETRDYTAVSPVSEAYALNLAAYFAQLATDYLAGEAKNPARPPVDEAPSVRGVEGGTESMAELVFGEYFALLTQAVLQAAADLLAELPVPYAAGGPSLATLAAQFPTVGVPVAVARAQTAHGIAAMAGVHPARVEAALPAGAMDGEAVVELPHGVTPLSIAQDNAGKALAAVTFNAAGMAYQVRAGQTLDGVAGAIPQQTAAAAGQILGPLTGASVGAANAALPGLLRLGAGLTIPSFTYTPVAGDTDTFLPLFFQVRNQGTAGVPYADWYAQAIATLNPAPVDWSQWGTATLTVPGAYLDTTATATYVVHPGDTFERVAATLALYQQGPAGNPVSGSWTVPAMTHAVTPTDTFAGLTVDFPGLAEGALIAANTAADVLAPLTPVLLPAFGVQVTAGQSLAQLAAAFDLPMDALVPLVENTTGLFQATTLTVRDVPGLSVDALAAAVAAEGPANEVAAQVSRFLLHGLRVPSPRDTAFTSLTPEQVLEGAFTGSLYGSFDAAGLQYGWADTSVPVTIELATTAGWVTLMDATVHDGGALGASVAALNPSAAAGAVMATGPATSISVTVSDAPPFDAWIPSATLTLDTTAAAMPLGETEPTRYELQSAIHWQAAAQPALDGGPGTAPGEPSVWLFSDALRTAALAAAQAGGAAFGLLQRPLNAPAGQDGTALSAWAWGVRIPFTIHRVPALPPPGVDPSAVSPDAAWLPTTYVVDGADQAGEDLLYALWTHLASTPADAGSALYLLYPPNATGDAPNGLASDRVAAGGAYLLKTNLSTETRQPFAARAVAGADDEAPHAGTVHYSADLGDAAAFTTFLWEATSVQAGGFYLHYEVDGDGFPGYVFDPSGRATLTLLCLLATQTGNHPGRTILPLNNCGVVEDNVDASATQVYAVQTSGTIPTTTVSTLPAGNVGFTLTRPDPVPPDAEPTPAQATQLLYNLFGYQVAQGGGFAASNEALPAGPGDAPGGGSDWYYQQVLQASRMAQPAGRIAQACAALPPPGRDPYAGVSAIAAVSVAFAAHDAFGNRAVATDPLPSLALPFRYADPLVGVGEWPGATVGYRVAAGSDSVPRLEIDLALQSGNYLPGPGVETAVALQAASAHALRYERVFYQLARPGMAATTATTLAPASEATPLALSLARFQGFVNTAYVFTSQLAGLPPVWHTTGTGETLASVAAAYSVIPEDLLVTNADHDAGTMFAAPVIAPVFERVKQRETIDAFAQRTNTQAAALLQSYANGDAPVAAGVSVAVAPATFPADHALTLADMALAAGCTPADVAAANAAAAGLITDGVQFLVRGVLMVADASTTFTTLAAAYQAMGVTTTPSEIGAANAQLPGIFVQSTPEAPVSYTVDRWVVPPAMTVDALVAARFAGMDDFVARNGDTPGVLAQNTPLQTGVETRTAPTPVSVRAFAERTLAITVAQFAAANAVQGGTGAPAIPTLAEGVRLMLPALLDPAPLSAVAYALAPGESLDVAAARFGTTAQALGTSIQNIGGVFNPGQPVSVDGVGPVYTTAEDSIESLRESFPAGQWPTLDALIAVIAPSTTLLRAGAPIVAPPAVVGPATTLTALAGAYGVTDVVALGRCNAALDTFLDPAASVTWNGVPTQVGPHGTLASLYRRAVGAAPATGFDAFLAGIAGQDLLRAGASAILPPPSAWADVALPAQPAVTGTITELRTSVTIARPTDQVAGEFGAASSVAARTTPVTASTSGVPASYTAFAQALQSAYGGALRVGSGKAAAAAGPSRARLYVVRFEAPGGDPAVNAIRQVSLPNEPSFYALPPLCRELLSRAAQVRAYVSGSEPPFATAQTLEFRAVDAQAWAAEMLAAVDLALSTAYAAGAFAVTRGEDGTSAAFDGLVAAKQTLAEKISAQLAPVVPESSRADPASAREALRQRLDVSLTGGWSTAAVVQVPSQVDASFATTGWDAGGHRFAGKPLPGSLELGGTSTLGGIAGAFTVDVQAIGRVLGGTPNLLEPGLHLQAREGGPVWTVGPHDTLQEGAAVLDITLDALSVAFADTQPLFRDGVTVTLNGYAATVAAGDSLESVSDQLASGVAFVAVANQTVAGLLTGTVFVDGKAHPVTPETDTLATMAASLAIPVDALAVTIAGQAVLAAGRVLHVAALLPDNSLSASKIDLDRAEGAVNVVVQLADPARYRRVLLDLGFPLTGFEYAVTPAPLTDGYETSDWLQFVTPLTGEGASQPASIDVAIGQVEIPIPLRAYPAPPVLVGQYADPVPGDTLARARQWTYRATWETQMAAQDLVWLTVGFNYAPRALSARLLAGDDPFEALAEYTANAAAIGADLRNVLLPPAELAADPVKRAAAKSATEALADIAAKVAATWGPIPPDARGAGAEDPLVPQMEVTVTMETRTRAGAGGVPLIDLLLLTRQAGSAEWGPDGVQPWLGYVDAAGMLHLLQPQAVSGHPDQLAYIPQDDVPAFDRRVFAIVYPGLDVITTQNARTSLWITRNELLVPGQPTSEAFVYRTPATHFSEVMVPALVHAEPIPMGSGPLPGLTAALDEMFTALLGDPPEDARVQLAVTVRYGYEVAPGLPVISPVVMRPLFPYASTVSAEITAAVGVWIGANPPAPGTAGFMTMELMVFPDILPNRQQPLLDLLRLDYALTS